MILVDTSVIIEFWKNPTDRYKKIFSDNNIAVCGITFAELIHGARSDSEIDKIVKSLDCFVRLEVKENDWIEIGKLLNNLKKKGISVPFQDSILAYTALKHNAEIWTNDKHFDMIKTVFSDLKIFELK